MENLANLTINRDQCIGCGKCIRTCPSGIFYLDEQKKAAHIEIKEFGWDGCWKCQHCLAVCPEGAISVLGKRPENSLLPPDKNKSGPVIDRLIANRRSHRRYVKKNVDPSLIRHILEVLQNAPNGGNKSQVEYTLIDDIEQMDIFRKLVYQRMDQLAEQGIYAESFDETSYSQLKEAEKTVRPDMLFCSAPHLLIPHAPAGRGCWQQDTDIACAYFELLCSAHGLGAVIMSYPVEVLKLMPDLREMLEIPENHYFGMMAGFGFPEISYARGVQKEDELKVHRLCFT